MAKRVKAYKEEVEAMWDDGKGSLHPDFDPSIDDGVKAPRETEELAMAIVKNDLNKVYTYIEEGADVNFVFGDQYSAPEGYTPLMIAAHRASPRARRAPPPERAPGRTSEDHRALADPPSACPAYAPAVGATRACRAECAGGRLEAAKALLRAGADPNYLNNAGDTVLFWGIDGGIEIIKLLVEYGVDLDARNPDGWTALQYARARGKYGRTYEKGIYPEDVLLYYGATEYGTGPTSHGTKSPRNSYDPEADDFMRERNSYQEPPISP